MNLQEINEQLNEWVKEGQVNGNPENRSVILIAMDKTDTDKNTGKDGTTCIQLNGSDKNLAKSLAEALNSECPLDKLFAKAMKISMEKKIADKLMEDFLEFAKEELKKEQKGEKE